MVTTRFIGRLGNSMFQIAACIGYAKKYGYRWGVPNDQRESSILTHFPNLPRSDGHSTMWPMKNGYDESYFKYTEIPNVGPDVLLAGFFQSEKYFENAKDEVREVFKLKHIDGYENCASIHLRFGDYLQHPNSFPPVTEVYIHEVLKGFWFVKKFVVFSDDIERCKEIFKKNFNEVEIEYSERRNEYEDLSLMASCSHHVIANSSFSWWGAWLGHNPNKIVISPDCTSWFGPAGPKETQDLLPDEWIKIKFR